MHSGEEAAPVWQDVDARVTKLYTDAYINDDYLLDPTASPLFAPDEMLQGLPEAMIFSCAEDIWRDEAEEYASRLLKAGVPIRARRFTNSKHGFVVRCVGQYEEAHKMIFDALGRVFSNSIQLAGENHG